MLLTIAKDLLHALSGKVNAVKSVVKEDDSSVGSGSEAAANPLNSAEDHYGAFFHRPTAPTPAPAAHPAPPGTVYKLEGLHPDDLSAEQRQAAVAALRTLLEARGGRRGGAAAAAGPGGGPYLDLEVRSGCIALQVTAYGETGLTVEARGPDGSPHPCPTLEALSDIDISWSDIAALLPPDLRDRVAPPSATPAPHFRFLSDSGGPSPPSSSVAVLSPDRAGEIIFRLRVSTSEEGLDAGGTGMTGMTGAVTSGATPPAAAAASLSLLSDLWRPVVYLGSDPYPLETDSELWAGGGEFPGPTRVFGDDDLSSFPPPRALEEGSGDSAAPASACRAAVVQCRVHVGHHPLLSDSAAATRLTVHLAPRDGRPPPAAATALSALVLPAAAARQLVALSPRTAAGVAGDLISVLDLLEPAEAAAAEGWVGGSDAGGEGPSGGGGGSASLPPQVRLCTAHLSDWASRRRLASLASVARRLSERVAAVEGGEKKWGEDMAPWTLAFRDEALESAYLASASPAALRRALIAASLMTAVHISALYNAAPPGPILRRMSDMQSNGYPAWFILPWGLILAVLLVLGRSAAAAGGRTWAVRVPWLFRRWRFVFQGLAGVAAWGPAFFNFWTTMVIHCTSLSERPPPLAVTSPFVSTAAWWTVIFFARLPIPYSFLLVSLGQADFVAAAWLTPQCAAGPARLFRWLIAPVYLLLGGVLPLRYLRKNQVRERKAFLERRRGKKTE